MVKDDETTTACSGALYSIKERKVRRWFYLYVYCRHIYRHHMRLLHRLGHHWFTDVSPMGGESHKWCQWCGERRFGNGP